MVFNLKRKDEINLSECEVILKEKLGLSENNKFMFTLNYKRKTLIGNKVNKLILGTDSELSRRDWVFAMQLSRRLQNKMRDSVLYLNELKKLSILSITMERKEDEIRKSMTADGKLLETMKMQA